MTAPRHAKPRAQGAASRRFRLPGAWLGAALAALLAFAWVLLTAATGKTYHLAPLLTAAAPAIVVLTEEKRLPSAWLSAAVGLVAATAGWLVILAAGIQPAATFVPHQPGGVWLEVVVGGVFGATFAALLVAAHR